MGSSVFTFLISKNTYKCFLYAQILFHPYVHVRQAPTVAAAKAAGIVVEAYSLLTCVPLPVQLQKKKKWTYNVGICFSPVTHQPGGPLDKPLAQIGARLQATPDQVLMAWAKSKGVVVVTYVLSSLTTNPT